MVTKQKTLAEKLAQPPEPITAKTLAEEGRAWELKKAVEALMTQAGRAIQLHDALKRYAAELQSTAPGGLPVRQSERFGWAINEIENYLRNINFAELGRRMASMAEAGL